MIVPNQKNYSEMGVFADNSSVMSPAIGRACACACACVCVCAGISCNSSDDFYLHELQKLRTDY